MGMLTNCFTLALDEMKEASRFSSFDTAVWNIKEGSLPTLVCPLYKKA